jgi:uncharacterized tellurite resistance protein B-like protein
MHVLLGLLGSLVTILYLLDRLGIDIGGLNPFAWRRRRSWRQKFEANPIFSLSDPRDMAAVMLVGVAKIDGDLTAGEKLGLLTEFERAFSLSAKAASELLSSTVYLLGDMQVLSHQAEELLGRYREHLAPDQINSLLEMIDRIAALDGEPTSHQVALVELIRQTFGSDSAPQGTWG